MDSSFSFTKFFAVLLVLAGFGYWYFHPAVGNPDKLISPISSPVVEKTDKQDWKLNENAAIVPIKKIEGKGAVLAIKKFSDTISNVMPYQMFIGWGPMSVYENFRNATIGYSFMGGRVANACVPPGCKISEEDYQKSVANIYVVPSDNTIQRKFAKIRQYDVIEFSGYLIDVVTPAQKFVTSPSLDEFKCKIIWFDRLEIIVN